MFCGCSGATILPRCCPRACRYHGISCATVAGMSKPTRACCSVRVIAGDGAVSPLVVRLVAARLDHGSSVSWQRRVPSSEETLASLVWSLTHVHAPSASLPHPSLPDGRNRRVRPFLALLLYQLIRAAAV